MHVRWFFTDLEILDGTITLLNKKYKQDAWLVQKDRIENMSQFFMSRFLNFEVSKLEINYDLLKVLEMLGPIGKVYVLSCLINDEIDTWDNRSRTV